MSLSNRFISLILMPLAVAFNSAEGAPQKQGNKKSLDIPAPVIVSPRGSLLGNLNFSKTLPGPSATLLVKDPNSLKIHNFNCASLNRASTDLLMGIDSKNAVPFTNPEQIKDAKGRLGCKSYDI